MTAVALTIAGSDSSGGAGIQADLKTFAAFAVFGTSAITAVTAQNTRGVSAIANIDPTFVAAQIDAVADDFTITAAKTGMLSRAEIIDAVADRIRTRKIPNIVVDPVMVAASGDVLLEPDAIAMMRDVMLPLATVVTPNLREASILTGRDVADRNTICEAARALVALGARAALVKGGSPAAGALADVQNRDAIDILYDGHDFREFRAPRVAIGRVHGAGCTLSAAIAASLARGDSLEGAVDAAKHYVIRALQKAPQIGHGSRPLNHSVSAWHIFQKGREAHSMTIRSSFTHAIRAKAQPIWDRELKHPFVRGLGDGTLAIDRFRFYLAQDYVFLIEYCRVFALAAAKAHDLLTIGVFARLLDETLNTEMQLHRDYCQRLGIAQADLEATVPAPITHAYTRHLLTVAYSGSIAEIVAAVLPCQLGYAEIATGLVREGRSGANSTYAEWIGIYSSREFIAGAEKLRSLLDDLTAGWPAHELTALETHFLTSSRYEYLFWEMAWTQSSWPV